MPDDVTFLQTPAAFRSPQRASARLRLRGKGKAGNHGNDHLKFLKGPRAVTSQPFPSTPFMHLESYMSKEDLVPALRVRSGFRTCAMCELTTGNRVEALASSLQSSAPRGSNVLPVIAKDLNSFSSLRLFVFKPQNCLIRLAHSKAKL